VKKTYYGAGSRAAAKDKDGIYPEPVSYWSLVANMGLPSVRRSLTFETMTEIDQLLSVNTKEE
jgi:hypothetical protein